MANEIWITYEEGLTLYALIWRKTDNKIYDVVAGSDTFVTYTDADIDTYDLVLSNQADSDYYSVNFPSDISAGTYHVQIMRQIAGAIHADNDVGAFQGGIDWDGTSEITLSSVPTADEIWAKAMSDLAAGAPSVTASVLTAINYLYEAWRNKTITNSANNEVELYKDDGITKLCESDIDDNGTSFTKGKYGAPD